jgi:hypothetical protein
MPGKAVKSLIDAYQRRGPSGLRATHYLLQGSDQEYREAVRAAQDEEAKNEAPLPDQSFNEPPVTPEDLIEQPAQESVPVTGINLKDYFRRRGV